MSNSNSSVAVVVGGGVAGLVAALILAREGRKVHLIESEPKLGGLLKTYKNEDGVSFDCGTHVLRETGISKFDKLLFGHFDSSAWQTFDRLRSGGYFNGKMNCESPFINLCELPEDQRNSVVYGILATDELGDSDEMSALEFSMRMYGRSLTCDILEPLMRKLYGTNMADLQPMALGLVGYTRFIGFDQFQTHEIKKSEFYDRKFAFTSWDDGVSSMRNFYPRKGGVQAWIDGLEAQLLDLNGTIHTNTTIQSISRDGDVVTSVVTDQGKIKLDDLYWTVSPANLFKLIEQPFPKGLRFPEFRSGVLLHLEFDENFLTDLQFFYCHDPDKLTFRTTLYSNLRAENKGKAPFNCTIEVMCDADTGSDPNLGKLLLQEMREMGVISDQHNVTFSKLVTSPKGFPIPTLGFDKSMIELAERCEDLADNLVIMGRATGKVHFMNDVLCEIWDRLSKEGLS